MKKKVPMAMLKALLMLALGLALCLQVAALGETIICEKLGKKNCAFAVSSTGNRCLLEKTVRRRGDEAYSCKTSTIDAAESLKSWIETDYCINSCGLDRYSLGISSDSLVDSKLAEKLCSTGCYGLCPNVVDLYYNLAAGEGLFLPKFCAAKREETRRDLVELRNSDVAAGPSPVGGARADEFASVGHSDAPAPVSG